jgi:hypothetical protein
MPTGIDSQFSVQIAELWNAAGRPPYVDLAAEIKKNEPSGATVPTPDLIGKIIRGRELSKWIVVEMVVKALHRHGPLDEGAPTIETLKRLWAQAKDKSNKLDDTQDTTQFDRKFPENVQDVAVFDRDSDDDKENETTARWESLFTILDQLDLDAQTKYETGTGALVSTRKVNGSYGWSTLHPHVCTRRGGKLLIGRSNDCDIRLEHETVSRKHAQMNYLPIGGRIVWMITDLDSTNGVALNDEMIPVRLPIALSESGTRLKMGNFELVYVDYEKWMQCSVEQKNSMLGIGRWTV